MNKVDTIFPPNTYMWQIPYHMYRYRNTKQQVDDFVDAAVEFMHLLACQEIIDYDDECRFRDQMMEFYGEELERLKSG